ncbi:hypothetical protein VZT92_026542 [Zoarces viviparus]|uniref:Uncharacterized protein n=1 Tax=Zoarces viviparus TaxID=48416 RepID=A0AAW1DZZ1_ZOAVI
MTTTQASLTVPTAVAAGLLKEEADAELSAFSQVPPPAIEYEEDSDSSSGREQAEEEDEFVPPFLAEKDLTGGSFTHGDLYRGWLTDYRQPDPLPEIAASRPGAQVPFGKVITVGDPIEEDDELGVAVSCVWIGERYIWVQNAQSFPELSDNPGDWNRWETKGIVTKSEPRVWVCSKGYVHVRAPGSGLPWPLCTLYTYTALCRALADETGETKRALADDPKMGVPQLTVNVYNALRDDRISPFDWDLGYLKRHHNNPAVASLVALLWGRAPGSPHIFRLSLNVTGTHCGVVCFPYDRECYDLSQGLVWRLDLSTQPGVERWVSAEDISLLRVGRATTKGSGPFVVTPVGLCLGSDTPPLCPLAYAMAFVQALAAVTEEGPRHGEGVVCFDLA